MKIRAVAAFLLAGGVFFQPIRAQVTRTIEIDPAKPREIVATLDGTPVTAEEFQQLIVAMDPKVKEATRNDAVEMLRYVGWLRRMGAEAEKRGLAAQNPLKTQLEMARIQLLSNAVIQQHELEEVVTPFEQRGYYQANLASYSGVKLKLIYVPFSTETEELQAKRKLEEVHRKLQGGANFVAMVKEYSKNEESREKDGDFGEVRLADRIPQTVKDVAYKLKDGEFSAPVRLPNGYYIFQRTGTNTDPYEKVKDPIFTEIKQKRNLEWVERNRKAVVIEMKPSGTGKDPKRVVALLEGQPVTAADVEVYLGAMDEKLRANLRDSQEEMLRGIGFMRRMTKVAAEQKLDQAPPFRQQLELTRLQALSNALIQAEEKSVTVSEADVKKAYADNLRDVSAAKLKIVFFSAAQESEAENQAALQLAREVKEKIEGGADFVEMVKQYSKDPVSRDKNGDYGPLKITDDIPAPAKQAIWGMAVGGVSAPVKLPNGYYLFKLIALEEPGIEKVREELTRRLRAAKSREWLNAMRAQVQVKLTERKPEAAK
ncbi:MAG: peptidylprolyl isomerase [Acidobacteria bacterium]|nr:peptidylprolyl isomerase [Acidobacteriota bacterium]